MKSIKFWNSSKETIFILIALTTIACSQKDSQSQSINNKPLNQDISIIPNDFEDSTQISPEEFIIKDDNSSYRLSDIDVEQKDKDGIIQFTFSTKNARINENSMNMKANNSSLIFYHNNNPYYDVVSDEASLINDGQTIILNNNVNMKSVQNSNLQIQTNKVSWDKKSSTALLEGGIKSMINGSTFYSEKAIYDHELNTVKFFGIKEYQYSNKSFNTQIAVLATNATWYGKNNKLQFSSGKNQVKTKIFIFDIAN